MLCFNATSLLFNEPTATNHLLILRMNKVFACEVLSHILIQLHISCCCLYNLRTAALRLIVRSWLDVPTFATRRLHTCHHARAPSGRRWNCGREMSSNFAERTISTPFRDLLQAVKLRHGTNGFTSSPKEGVLRIFSP